MLDRVAGLLVIAAIVVANLASSLVAQTVMNTGNKTMSPFFMIYFNVSFDVVAFALSAAMRFFQQRYDHCGASRQSNTSTRALARGALPLCLLYQAGNYLYMVALKSKMSISVVSL